MLLHWVAEFRHVVVVHKVSAGQLGPLTQAHSSKVEFTYVHVLLPTTHEATLQDWEEHTDATLRATRLPGAHPPLDTLQDLVEQISSWTHVVGVLTHDPEVALQDQELHASFNGAQFTVVAEQ